MTGSPRFPHRPSPWPDESGIGYVARVAELSGYASLPWPQQMFDEASLVAIATDPKYAAEVAYAAEDVKSRPTVTPPAKGRRALRSLYKR